MFDRKYIDKLYEVIHWYRRTCPRGDDKKEDFIEIEDVEHFLNDIVDFIKDEIK